MLLSVILAAKQIQKQSLAWDMQDGIKIPNKSAIVLSYSEITLNGKLFGGSIQTKRTPSQSVKQASCLSEVIQKVAISIYI